MVSAAVINKDEAGLLRLVIVQWLVYIRFSRIVMVRIIEAVTWVKKYFVVASVDHGLLL